MLFHGLKRIIGEGIGGEMGEGIVENGLWLHPEFKENGYNAQIQDVIEGKVKRIRLKFNI